MPNTNNFYSFNDNKRELLLFVNQLIIAKTSMFTGQKNHNNK